MVSKGLSGMCSGVGMLCGMEAIGCIRGDFVVGGVLVRVVFDIGVCSGRSVFLMYAYHEGCMSVVFGVESLGSLRCSVPAGRSTVDCRVSIAVRSCILGLALLPCGSLARMASVGCMWYAKATWEVGMMVSRLFHLKMPVSQSGARCLRR